MASITAIKICSNARQLCGETSIAAFEEDSTGLTGNLWDMARTSTLRLGTWSRSRRRALLSPTATPPAWGWAYEFILPPDCLRVVSVGETGETIEYEHEDGKLLSDEASIKLRYVYDNTNPGTWDPVLVEAVTFHMAALVAYSITGSKSLQDAMQANFAAVLEAARGINAEEAPVDSFGDNPLFAARSSGWGS